MISRSVANPSGTKEKLDRPASATPRRFHLSKNLPTTQLDPLDRLRYRSPEHDAFFWQRRQCELEHRLHQHYEVRVIGDRYPVELGNRRSYRELRKIHCDDVDKFWHESLIQVAKVSGLQVNDT